jgi:Rod binding domain-containing protein
MSLEMNFDTKIQANSSISEGRLARFADLAKESKVVGKREMPMAEKAKMAEAARGFEAMFLNMLMKEMKGSVKSMGSDKEQLATFGAETLEGYNDMAFADEMSKVGKGMGIADMIFKQLTGGEDLYNITKFDATGFNPKSGSELNWNTNSNKINENFKLKLNERIGQFKDVISDAASQNGIDINIIKAVIAAESAGKPDAVSSAGAKGLMQIMDGTASELGIENVFNPKENIQGGSKYLKNMIDKFGNLELGLAAYNSGAANIDKYGGIPPFPETQSYVKKVKNYIQMFNTME